VDWCLQACACPCAHLPHLQSCSVSAPNAHPPLLSSLKPMNITLLCPKRWCASQQPVSSIAQAEQACKGLGRCRRVCQTGSLISQRMDAQSDGAGKSGAAAAGEVCCTHHCCVWEDPSIKLRMRAHLAAVAAGERVSMLLGPTGCPRGICSRGSSAA
jgi:hypothetical protein